MNTHKLTVELPAAIFEQLTELAQQQQSSPEVLVEQGILTLLPNPHTETQPFLNWAQMQQCSQEQLLKITQEQISLTQQERHSDLLERNQSGTITAPESLELQDLRLAGDRLMLRKAYAWDLLAQRGYSMPTLDELPLNLE